MMVEVYYGVYYSLEDDGFNLGQAFAKHGFHNPDAYDHLIDGASWFANGEFGSMDVLLGTKNNADIKSELEEYFESEEFEELINKNDGVDVEDILEKGVTINNTTYVFIKVY